MGLEMLDVKLDTRSTIENVRDFFEEKFPRLVTISEFTTVDLKSPSFDSEPHGGADTNSNESKALSYIEANRMVENVLLALKGMYNQQHASVLKQRHLLGLQWLDISERYGYSTRQMQRIQNKAMLEFADSFAKYHELRKFI